ncbi:MAG: hypothetical protein Q8O52_07460 [Sulfuritalea sp.]|nr:hypothetical protein [Sulfuritalea sp.]
MIEGSCLCGGIRYQYDGEIEEISICHCSQCRKAQGSAFAAASPVETPFVCANAFHIFTDSKASWWDCDDDLPRFAQRRP